MTPFPRLGFFVVCVACVFFVVHQGLRNLESNVEPDTVNKSVI